VINDNWFKTDAYKNLGRKIYYEIDKNLSIFKSF